MADTKTCKCQNCGATIDVESGKTSFNSGDIDRVAELEKKVNKLAQLAGKNSRKPKGDKPHVTKKEPEDQGREGGDESSGFLPF